MKEATVKRHIKEYLQSVGAYSFTQFDPQLDRTVCYKGMFIGIEAKKPGQVNNTTDRQLRTIQLIKNAGGFAFVTDDVEQVREVIRRYDEIYHAVRSSG
jgi:hypothetical protein